MTSALTIGRSSRKDSWRFKKKEIERPEALDIEEFVSLHEGILLQNPNQFCHVSFTQLIGLLLFKHETGGEKRSMTMRQFILDLGLYTPEEMGNNLFMPFYESCFRSRPHNYDPTEYVINITTRDHCDTQHPPSYTSIRNLIRRLVHRLLALSDAGEWLKFNNHDFSLDNRKEFKKRLVEIQKKGD
nr:hypothetical protein [Tanacetum cinerariifolium]